MNKKDKEWLKDEVNGLPLRPLGFSVLKLREEYAVNKDDVMYLIDQLDEPQKPVIPQFVADYIEYYKATGITLGTWFDFVHEYEFERKTEEWIYSGSYEENLKREYLLIDAIRNGYEVEKEQKYQVIIRDGEYIRLFLCKNEGNVMIGTNGHYIEKCPEVTYLTEKEIKDFDERYWAFAEEVKE